MLGQELSQEEEEQHAELVQAAKDREVAPWRRFDVYEPRKTGNVSKQLVHTRWALTWKMADGQASVKARSVAKGYPDRVLQAGDVDTSGCVSLRSSHLQVISLSEIKQWKLRSLDIKNACLPADGFDMDVSLQAPDGWGPRRSGRG